jgi:trimethylamine:corrinoid methyltransferase-like protein
MSVVHPTLTALSEEQIREIHELALSILEKTGIRVDDAGAKQIFTKAIGGSVKDDRVYIPREITEWAIDAAPSKVAVSRRDGQAGFVLDSEGTDRTIFGIGVTNLHYQDVLTDKVIPFGRRHMVHATRLGDALAEFDTISTPGVIQDCTWGDPEVIGALEMVANTQKPLILLISEPSAFKTCLNMFDQLIGESACKNAMMPYFNPITPLVLNAETTYKIDLTVSRGMPFIFSNYGMSGATCPITPGGTLVVLLAELLSGLVFSQLLKEGTPIVLGSLPAVFDMQKMNSYYSPQSLLLNLACGEMMAHYNLPHCGTSGGSMGRGPDLIAGGIIWMNHLTSILGKTGLIPFVGSNFDSMVFSPATAVYAAEVIRMARKFRDGFSLDPGEIGLDEIISLGPGGNYLMSDLTMEKFKQQMGAGGIWPSLQLDEWKDQGRPKAGDALRKHTLDLLDQAEPPEDHDDIIHAGEAYLKSLPDPKRN